MSIFNCILTGSLNRSLVDLPGNGGEIIEGSAVSFGWSNVSFHPSSFDLDWESDELPPDPELIPGTPPTTFLLRLLTSTGTGLNGEHDFYETGVGLGIPESLIDVASFTDLVDPSKNFDVDVNQRVFFILTEPEPARRFIERELCRPFGYYLATTNAGKIRCVRPRHPQKFYVGASNQLATIEANGNTVEGKVRVGVYTADELVAQMLSMGFSLSYEPLTWQFTLSGSGFKILPGHPGSIWKTIGFTTSQEIDGPVTGEIRGKIPDEIAARTLTQDDMWNVQVLDNRADRIASVSFHYDYDIGSGRYLTFRRYSDPESVNLLGTTSSAEYVIRSRGLQSGTHSWLNHVAPPTHGCSPMAVLRIPKKWTVDADTWTQLHAWTLIDRYKHPPLKFRANLRWKWNTLEVGDIVRIDYSRPGVFIDFERGTSTLDNRLFEVIGLEMKPDASIEATFLGHRHVSY